MNEGLPGTGSKPHNAGPTDAHPIGAARLLRSGEPLVLATPVMLPRTEGWYRKGVLSPRYVTGTQSGSSQRAPR